MIDYSVKEFETWLNVHFKEKGLSFGWIFSDPDDKRNLPVHAYAQALSERVVALGLDPRTYVQRSGIYRLNGLEMVVSYQPKELIKLAQDMLCEQLKDLAS